RRHTISKRDWSSDVCSSDLNLIRLVGRRLVLLPIMVLGVTFLVFVLMSLSPIDPAYAALGESATPEALAAYRETNGLNDPWYIQIGRASCRERGVRLVMYT